MRTKKGLVTSDKMNKTIVVSVHSYKSHPKYKKRYRVTKKFYAHDENNTYKEGDVVVIRETKPTSKLKRWEVVEKK
ncbi:30S ribosomal protein S17 [Candidatus Gracilibacteria bacterium HOT-871]|nr:30S ribosomal protein S17 [Candidatus Gracilibacteria bacterium HOT-871]MBB1565318.1 30S ribosomal protein S17 [Candidatus Gracilibacteria bacterium]RKW22299.1 MAG: 30S ribosomal protein S17 [Candidatus Gracilibacteria bacterium]